MTIEMTRQLGPSPPASSVAVHRTMMSNRGRDTSPELILRSALYEAGIRGYRLHKKGVPGRPDIVFSRKKLAIFVNGCYWHRCPRCNLSLPKTHREFWKKKFELNVARDNRKKEELRKLRWRVIVLWECEVRKNVDGCVTRIARTLDR